MTFYLSLPVQVSTWSIHWTLARRGRHCRWSVCRQTSHVVVTMAAAHSSRTCSMIGSESTWYCPTMSGDLSRPIIPCTQVAGRSHWCDC